MDRAFTFPFQNLDVYRLARSACRRVRAMDWPQGSSHLRDQAIRAADLTR